MRACTSEIVASGNHFRDLHRTDAHNQHPQTDNCGQLLASLQEQVISRFGRLSGLAVVTVPVGATDRSRVSASAIPSHPDCAAHAQSAYCVKSLQSHLDRLRRRPVAHWHRCRFGKLCAYVPVVWDRRCVAACNLVCPESMGQDRFERYVELLDVLVENFTVRKTELLSKLEPRGDGPAEVRPTLTPHHGGHGNGQSCHPRVLEAIEFIHRCLSDSNMTVTSVARHLDMNPSYLAHLFTEQTGTRMSRYIATRRIKLAEHCLTSTNWQIKRVAYESGHVNADWFSHVFHAHTGLTPRQYRRRMRDR